MSVFEKPEVVFAIQAVRQGALLAQQVQRHIGHASVAKHDRTPVTVADFAVQALISERLHKTFPDVPLVGEESAALLKQKASETVLADVIRFLKPAFGDIAAKDVYQWIDHGQGEPCKRFWTLDPIDGTRGFLRGGHYAVALALIEDGEVTVAALGCPTIAKGRHFDYEGPGSLIFAVKKEGAWVNQIQFVKEWERLHASERSSIEEGVLVRSYEGKHTDHLKTDRMMRSLGMKQKPIGMDSLAKYALVASGEADILMRVPAPDHRDYRENIWDQASGALIVEEAGGKITDLDGKHLDFSCGKKLLKNTGILATNGLLHDQMLKTIQQVLNGSQG
ncbi:MAG: 3'(2'),5'-bisphosphate nucleotidase [Candidatus Omnitrophica bacterium CG11_big_fil_rev_8_21_14_0_20_45_26]|uniref:3'(2'),5'-bisphosphate nucleotidase n=1 Tax=Candidatus Abzuiibacterium crystallinum TaxID=1974748 RepID=A0A2H0LQB0_9BACT|nr:MAG: 3'(2'),5'-bisphosphate nucleotidase [Candidatus Omnitrophica bacterium CG11_big_fil_rev_8_21_14_0_20_45_26]PIW63970.1 MAG: 3'(2'),5'-bisphosphate nucleotidase [Candidatus Omnitrophica bacterium CG12_big_fil_rev_8_21_14_0_65_45_16]